MAEEVKAFRWLLEDPASAKEEWLGKNIDGLAPCDILNCIMKWGEWFHVLSPLSVDLPQAIREGLVQMGITRRCSCYEGCHYMVCAHVLAMHISESGFGVVPMQYSTVRVAARAGVGRPQHGADQYGAQSAHVRGRGGRGGRGRSGARATKSPKTRTKRGQL
jgi:hypothetical protein